MKKINHLLPTLLAGLLLVSYQYVFCQITPSSPDNFITRWNTGSSTNIQLPGAAVTGESYNYSIYWYRVSDPSDFGTVSTTLNSYDITNLQPNEIYQVEIVGDFHHFAFNGVHASRLKLLDVKQWGTIAWKSMSGMFNGANNLEISAIDTPILSNVSSMNMMFKNCNNLTGVGANWNWNTSNVTDIRELFSGASKFNENINSWNISNVTSLEGVFEGASIFNQPLNNWNTSNVTSLARMFQNATLFNQDINSWDVSKVTTMSRFMFNNKAFNFPLNNWNTIELVDLSFAFEQSVYNNDITTWNTSKLKTLANTFRDNTVFNQDISGWNTSSLEDLNSAFFRCYSFNQDISVWDVSKVKILHYTFANASAFNQNLGSWNLQSAVPQQSINLFNMLTYSGLDCYNYSQTLVGWANNPNLPSNMNLGSASGLFYDSYAIAARDYLFNQKAFNIEPNTDILKRPAGTISSIDTTCVGSSFTMTSSEPNGKWYTSNGTIASINENTGLFQALSEGEVEISYSIWSEGCDSTVRKTITILPLMTNLNIVGDINPCPATVTTYSVNSNEGIWSTSNTAVATIDQDGILTPVGTGSVTVLYTLPYPIICDGTNFVSKNIVISDTVAPIITPCPTDTIIYLSENSCTIALPDFVSNIVATDNCGSPSQLTLNQTPQVGSLLGTGVHTITLTVSDYSLNSVGCNFMISIIDTIKPTFDTPTPTDTLTIFCSSDLPSAANISASDNCGNVTVLVDEHVIDSGCVNNYQVIRRWIATDNSNNSIISQPQVILVVDQDGPTFQEELPLDTIIGCTDTLPAIVGLTAIDCADPLEYNIRNLQNLEELQVNLILPNFSTDTEGFGVVFENEPIENMLIGASAEFIESFNGITVSLYSEPLVGTVGSFLKTRPANEIRIANSKFTIVFSQPVPFLVTGNPWLNEYEKVTFEGDGKLYVRNDQYGVDFYGNNEIITSISNPYYAYNPTNNVYQACTQIFGGLGTTFSVIHDQVDPANARFFAYLVRTDNDSIPVTMQQDTIPGACPNTFTITRTYSAADLCGNITQHVQTISVVDSIKPVFDIATLPLDTTVNCDAIPSALTTIIASDNCTDTLDVIISVNEVTTQGTAGTSAFSNYTITRTYTATDLCGNAEIFVHTITVQDTVKPIITNCPNDFTHYLAMDSCSYSVVDFTTSLIVTDNCTNSSDLTITQSPAVGTVLNLGQNTITISVDDNSGNIQTCQFEITVVDTIQPIFVNCPPDIYLYATDNSCVVAAQWLEPTVQDNCTNTITVDQTNGGDYSVGTTNVNYIAVDPTGIETTCSFKIIVIDTIKPLVAITDISSAVCVGSPITWTEQISDNCQVQSITSSHVSGSIFPAGTTTVTYTVTDMSDNQTTYSFDVTTNPAPTVALTTDTMEVCINRDVTLSVAAPDLSNTYDWFYNGLYVNSSPDYAIAQVNDNTVGTYVVQATNSHGCIATDTLYLTYDICGIKIVETFSANSDGQNDYFVVQGIEQYPNTEVWIYNRWGTEVYHSTNYQNDWNGKSQSKYNVGGDELPESTYFYVLKLGGDTSLPNAGETFKGYVYMRR